jgi:NADH:ubiquinone oxidoreductase subunit E
MKEIDKMNLAELAEIMAPYSDLKERIINRLRVIHEETRWISVSERMPTEEDCTKIKYAQHLNVLAMDVFGDVRVTNYSLVTESHGYKAWKRITPPEAKP